MQTSLRLTLVVTLVLSLGAGGVRGATSSMQRGKAAGGAASRGVPSRGRGLVRQAILNTDPAYLRATLDQRNPGPKQRGSRFLETVTVEQILKARWRPYDHPALGEGTRGFRASIPGKLGMVPLHDLDPSALVTLDDPKHTGFLSAVVRLPGELPRARHSVIIIGENEGKPTVFTIHPGDPVNLPRIQATQELLGKTVTAKEAVRLGFEQAKIAQDP